MFDDRKAAGLRLAGSIQRETGEVQSQNDWIKAGS
jgi:hypothetical protein